MIAPNVYRYAYQGQYSEHDEETNWNHFELREWDATIGRWLVPDPARQHFSPYVGMGNDPVNGIDPDGGFDWFLNNTTGEIKQYEGQTTKEGWTSIAGDNASMQDIYDGLDKLVGFHNIGISELGQQFLRWDLAENFELWKLYGANLALATAYYGSMPTNARQGTNAFAGLGTNSPNNGVRLVTSIGTAMGEGYKVAGEVTVAIKNTDILTKLNRAAKGDWVKVYEAGILNGKRIETHYFRNNSTKQVFDVKMKYNYWHQNAFKKIGQ